VADPDEIDRKVAEVIADAESRFAVDSPAPVMEEARLDEAVTGRVVRQEAICDNRSATVAPVDVPWPPLRLPALADRPAFPLHTLESWHREYVEALAEERQVSPDGPAMLSLCLFGGAAAKRVEVAVGGEEVHPTNLWTLVVMASGEGKSPIVSPLASPFLQAQEERSQEARAGRKIARLERSILTQRRNDLVRACARAALPMDIDRLRADAAEVDGRLSQLEDPPLPRLLTEDTTNEALARLLAQNQGALALVSDEGSSLFANASRNARGGVEAIEVLLKAHSGTTFIRDRITTDSLTLHEPALTVAIATQATTFGRLVRRESFQGRGLWERFLLVLPRSRVGERKGSAKAMSLHQRTSYAGAIRSLLRLPIVGQGRGRLQLHLSDDARRKFGAFCEEIDGRMASGGDLATEAICAWANKIRTNVLRVGACILLSDFAPPLDLDERVMIDTDVFERAVEVMRYCLAHAQSVMVGPAELPADVEVALAWLRERKPRIFRVRDLQRARQATFARREQLDPVIDALVKMGIVRPVPSAGGPGRPPEECEVHPDVVGGPVTK
jgi:hypothetical protein